MTSLVAEFGTGQVLWSMFWFFMFFIWIYVMIVIFGDIFRSEDLGGWSKALWVIFVVIVPWLGILVYLIARGSKMQERMLNRAQQVNAQQRDYIQTVAASSGPSAAEEISRLADLKAQGTITDAEFAAAKAKVLSG